MYPERLELVLRTADAEKYRKWKYIDYRLINSIAEGGVQGTPINFEIPGAGDEYIDLCNSLIFVRLKVVKADRTIMGDDTVVAPTNVFLQSLFSQVDVYLSRTPITTASDM